MPTEKKEKFKLPSWSSHFRKHSIVVFVSFSFNPSSHSKGQQQNKLELHSVISMLAYM